MLETRKYSACCAEVPKYEVYVPSTLTWLPDGCEYGGVSSSERETSFQGLDEKGNGDALRTSNHYRVHFVLCCPSFLYVVQVCAGLCEGSTYFGTEYGIQVCADAIRARFFGNSRTLYDLQLSDKLGFLGFSLLVIIDKVYQHLDV